MDEFDQYKAISCSGGGAPLQRGFSFPGLTVSEIEDEDELEHLHPASSSGEVPQDVGANLENMQNRFKTLNLGDSLDVPTYDSNRLSVGQWVSQHDGAAGGRERGMFLRCNSNPNPQTLPISPGALSPGMYTPGGGALSPGMVSPGAISPGLPRRPMSVSPIPRQFSQGSDSPCTPSPPHSLHSARIRHRMGGLQAERMKRRTSTTNPNAYKQSSLARPDMNHFRALHHSMDSGRDREQQKQEYNQVYRVRSFITSPKGIINRGDSYRLRSFASNCSLESTASSPGGYKRAFSLASHGSYSTGSSMENTEGPTYRVLVLGSGGSGKTTLIQQFMTSEYLGNMENSLEGDDEDKTISVMLDNEESFLSFVDGLPHQSSESEVQSGAPPIMPDVDAYLVLYSVADTKSFHAAEARLVTLSKDTKRETAVILVANKSDIVRNRTVAAEAGKNLATQHECKYIEVSAGLNHKVDDLLVGILRQIRLKRQIPNSASNSGGNSGPNKFQDEANHEGPRGIVGRLFRRNSRPFRSCDNLMVG